MSDIFQIANIGLLDGKQRLEAISLNAASASLPGYRRQVVVGRAFDAVLATDGVAPLSYGVAGSTVVGAATRPVSLDVDLQRGAVTATGRALDLAIEADDLFFALTDGTQTWLTRAGAFRLNEDGVLVGEGGLRVVGAQGDVRLPGTDVEVAADGRITHHGVVVAALQLFRPNDRAALQAVQGSMLAAPAGIQPAEVGAVQLRSGALEASNTDAGREMLSLMGVSRQFESLSRIVQSYDELLGRTIQKLGDL